MSVLLLECGAYAPHSKLVQVRDLHLGGMMSIKEINGVSYYSFEMLERWPELTQAAFTRLGGVSEPPYDTLNVSFSVQDDRDKVELNRGLAARAVGWHPNSIVSARQVHGRRALAVGKQEMGGSDLPDTDALVTDAPGVLLLLKFADCVPVILWDPVHRVVGLAHAGWRGTVAGTPAAALELMEQRYRSHPRDVFAAIGPSIGPCCYEVGAEVAGEVAKQFAGTSVLQEMENCYRFDLWSANAETLMRAGVAEENIQVAGICTHCRNDLFFSHRAAKGIAGRFGVVAGIRNG